ncbi:2-hydroxyacid dehydrogenase [Ectothiorhodospiraceae bacterium WFHF3C12]|nr:2-hydroxyacid dehydrogenase [Ectothiorhodospiraceae bacterium WFHF3C12]
MKAVFLDADSLNLHRNDLTALDNAVDELVLHGNTQRDTVDERIADAEIVIVNKVVLDRESLMAAPALRLVCVAATGLNNVDLDAASEQGIAVTHCRGYGTDSVAQHTLALILTLATNLTAYREDVTAGRWAESEFFCLLDHPIMELAGKQLGIIGLGTLGGRVAELARAFGMAVEVAQRPGSAGNDADRMPLDTLLRTSDVVTLHCPLTEDTRGLIGHDALARMKRTAYLVNTARGGIVDETALAQALRAGEIAGAAVDVLSEEPPVHGNPLLAGDIPNLILTPHCAWGSREARLRIVDQLAGSISGFRSGDPPRRVV